MAMRYLKIILVLFVGLQGWLYVAGNIANWHAGLGAVSYVISMRDHAVYPIDIFPILGGSGWATLAFIVILVGEFLVGALSLKGCWDLFKARAGSADAFNASKASASLGAGMAMVVWFGGFIVLGGALFQMWQTQVGNNSFNGAFIYAMTSGMVLLILRQKDA